MTCKMNCRVAAFRLVAEFLKTPLNDVLSNGWRYLGVCGANHVIVDALGRLHGADLVTSRVCLYVGHPPPISRW
jgi:hypothetical protein